MLAPLEVTPWCSVFTDMDLPTPQCGNNPNTNILIRSRGHALPFCYSFLALTPVPVLAAVCAVLLGEI